MITKMKPIRQDAQSLLATDSINYWDSIAITGERLLTANQLVTINQNAFNTDHKAPITLYASAPDNFADSFDDAYVIGSLGSGVRSTIDTPDDLDFFVIHIAADDILVLSYYNTPDTVVVNVYDENRDFIATIDQGDSLWVDGTQSGSYYVRVSGADQDSYTLNFQPPQNDVSDTTATNSRLSFGQMLTGLSHGPTDVDWYKLKTVRGETQKFAVDSLDPSIRPILQIISHDGTVIASGVDAAPGVTEIYVTFPSNFYGLYYLSIMAGTERGSEYNIYPPIEADDYPDNESTTGFIAMNGSVTGEISEEFDFDWFAFDGEAGQSMTFRISREASSSLPRLSIISADSDGRASPLTLNGSVDGDPTYTFSTTTSGRYYLIFTIDLVRADRSDYSISLSPSDEVPGGETSRIRMDVGTTYNGVIDFRNDTDSIGVWLEAGEAYVLTHRSHSNYYNGIRVYTEDHVSIFSPGNRVVGDFVPIVNTFTAPETGLYFISYGNSSINGLPADSTYQIEIDLIPDDHGDDLVDASSASLHNGITGTLEHREDVDWFSFELAEFDTVIMGTHNIINMFAFGDGNIVSYNPFYGSLSSTTAGTYYLQIGSGNSLPASPQYYLRPEIIADEAGSTQETSGTLHLDQTMTGMIANAMDQDWYAFDAQIGQTIQVEVASAQTSLMFSVLDQNGTVIGSSMTGAFEVEFAVTATFYLSVENFNQSTYATSYVINTGLRLGTTTIGTDATDIMTISAEHGEILAFSGNDKVIGSVYNDVVSLGAGNDRFYTGEAGGHDLIKDFDPTRDTLWLDIDPSTNWSNFVQMMTGLPSGLLITLSDGTTVLLSDVDATQINRNNIVFGSYDEGGDSPRWGSPDYDYGSKSGVNSAPSKGDMPFSDLQDIDDDVKEDNSPDPIHNPEPDIIIQDYVNDYWVGDHMTTLL